MAKKNLINADMLLATPRKIETLQTIQTPQLNTQSSQNRGHGEIQTALNTEGGILATPTEPLTPIEQSEPAQRHVTSVQRGLKIGETRATLIVQEAALEKIKAIAYWDRQSIKDVVQTIFDDYIASYEAKNGIVKPVP